MTPSTWDVEYSWNVTDNTHPSVTRETITVNEPDVELIQAVKRARSLSGKSPEINLSAARARQIRPETSDWKLLWSDAA